MLNRSIDPVIPQRFPFPYSMMLLIHAGKTATCQSKLIKTCKYFFIKDPIIVVNEAYIRKHTVHIFGGVNVDNDMERYVQPDNMNCKLWITSEIIFLEHVQNWSLLLSKIHQYDKVSLQISAQTLSYSNLKLFAKKGTCKELYMETCNIPDLNGLQVSIEKIVELFPMAESYRL